MQINNIIKNKTSQNNQFVCDFQPFLFDFWTAFLHLHRTFYSVTWNLRFFRF